jgi:hypothetical protein
LSMQASRQARATSSGVLLIHEFSFLLIHRAESRRKPGYHSIPRDRKHACFRFAS